MILFIYTTILVFFCQQIRFSLFEVLFPLAEISHKMCNSLTPEDIKYSAEIKAITCAENFKFLDSQFLYISSGLIHLFVVSGAHLILIRKILLSLLKPLHHAYSVRFLNTLLNTFLLVYCFCCLLNAPIIRSFISLVFSQFYQTRKLHLSSNHLVLFSGLGCLLFNPDWVVSLSLQLSWIIAISLSITNEMPSGLQFTVLKQTFHFLLISPSLIFFQNICFKVILLNIALAPFLELVLFPTALLTLFVHKIYFIFDYLIDRLQWILKLLEVTYSASEITSTSWAKDHKLVLFNWGFILTLHFFFYMFLIFKKRQTSN